MTTLLVFAPAYGHTKYQHPESSRRTAALWRSLESSGLLPDLSQSAPTPATVDQLRRAHTLELIEYVHQVALRGGGLLDHGDTYVTAQSFELAALAAGGCCAAVDAVMSGAADNGFALIRPPGHHAETDRVSGFCLFNNVAVAARQAQVVHGAQRVAIIDYDVHHGNGTQDIFYEDDSVLFVSLHLYAPYFYPGIGGMHEIGVGRGRGYTLNVPFPPYVGDRGYRCAFDELIGPRLAAFRPDLLLVSAGFDAHWDDPLASAGLSLRGYADITRKLISYAESLCDGRILFILEGGYHLDVLTTGVRNVLHALLGQDVVHDPFGRMPQDEHDVTDLLARLKAHYLSK
ncbi:MAG: histone deacetylase [Candidatus Promineofilum sp.]|nr:histone deacetylase [Promineifilum sp.]